MDIYKKSPLALSLFDTARMGMDEALELTIASLNEYGNRFEDWVIAWSGGKDSTSLLTLVVYLIRSKKIKGPKSLTVFYADTRLELTPLSISAYRIISQLRELGIEVKIVMAELDKRFFVYMLGRGVPPPNNKTNRWCTRQIKLEPMQKAIEDFYHNSQKKILVLTGVRQGESAVRDGRIQMSCSKDGAECGQGWYQQSLPDQICDTLAPLLHWRVCHIWDWLKFFAPAAEYGSWDTKLLADCYGGNEAEEINARTGCMGCPLVKTDKALEYVCSLKAYEYLRPLLALKVIFNRLRFKKNRLKKSGLERNTDGSIPKNPQRIGPLSLKARTEALTEILAIQKKCNEIALKSALPFVDIINPEEEARIRELIQLKKFPKSWTGDEMSGDTATETIYNDGSIQKRIFDN